MLRFTLALIALIALPFLAPSVSDAQGTALCTVDPGYARPATGNGFAVPYDGTGGCNALATDDYMIPAGSELSIIGDMTVNDVYINGGTLVVSGGIDLTVNGGFYANGPTAGGKLILEGKEVASGRIVTVSPSATNGTQDATVSFNTSSITSDHTIWFWEDDPDSALTSGISKPIQIGDGNPELGAYRPAFGKWTAYKVVSVGPGANDIRWEMDEFTGSLGHTYDANVFDGTRLLPSATPVAPASNVAQRYGGYSILTMTAAPGWILNYADLGKWYVRWTAGPCSGRLAKVTYTRDTQNEIWVAGNVEECGTSTVVLDPGWRVGDPVRVVDMATLDFNYGGSGDPACALDACDGAGGFQWDVSKVELKINGAKFMRMSGNTGTEISQNFDYINVNSPFAPYFPSVSATPMHGSVGHNFAVYQTDCDVNYASSSSIVNSEFAFTRSDVNDTSVFGGFSTDSVGSGPYTAVTDPGGSGSPCLTDLTGFTFDKNYIHDQVRNVATTGNHGVFFRGVTGARVTRSRIERMGDDLYGFAAVELGISSPNILSTSNLILYEQKPTTDNSAECHQNSIGNGADAEDGAFTTRYTVDEVIAIGCAGATFGSNMGYTQASRLVSGGSFNAITFNHGISGIGAADALSSILAGGATLAQIDAAHSTQDNVVILSAGESGGPSPTPASVWRAFGTLKDSVAYPPAHHEGTRLSSAYVIDGVFLPQSTDNTATEFLTSSGSGYQVETFTVRDSVLITALWQYASTFVYTAGNALGRPPKLSLNNVYLTTKNLGGNGLVNSGLSQSTSQETRIDGLILRQEPATDRAVGSANGVTNDGALVTRACVQTTQAATYGPVFGSAATATSHVVGPPGPSYLDDTTIRVFQGPGTGECADFYPDNFGLSERGYSAALLGDFWNEQWELRSTHPDPTGTSGGGGGSARNF